MNKINAFKFVCECCGATFFVEVGKVEQINYCPNYNCQEINDFTITGGYTVEGEEDEDV
jgi:hypothetical protein